MIINIFVCFQEPRRKKVPTCDGDNAIGVTRQQSKNGRKKRTKSKDPVAKQLQKRTTTVRRRNSGQSSPITSARTGAKVGRRRVTYAASGATDTVSDNEAEKSDTEVDDDDNTEQESSSDEAEDSLTLADVKRGLDEKGKHAGTFTGSDYAVTANIALAKSKGGRKTTTKKEQSPTIDATTVDSDVSCGDTHVIKRNIENSDEEKKAPNTKCTELIDEVVTIEYRITYVSADVDGPTIVPSVKLTAESLDISNGSVRYKATILDESKSFIVDGGDSPILVTETEKDAPIENVTDSKTTTPPVDTSCHEDDVTCTKEKPSGQIETNNADKSPSVIGCCAVEEQVIRAAAAAPQANKTAEDAEPVNGKTATAPLAAMPTPDDVDSAIDTEDECAHGDAKLPGEERNNEAVPAKEQTQTYDDTEHDIAEVASSENRTEIQR